LSGRVSSSLELVDKSEPVNSARAPSREIWLVGLALVVVALVYRHSWIHVSWEGPLDRIQDVVGLQVNGVGRWFSAWATGDGQAFAIMAADPLGLDEGWHLTQPGFRYLRVGFSWLVWIASLGQERWIPYAMAMVGALAIAGTFLLAARLRPALGLRAWLLVFNPAVLIGFAGDTAETVGILFLAWAIAGGSRWASAALGLIRPSYLVALLGRHMLVFWGAGAALTMGTLWALRFGFDPAEFGGSLGLPLAGYLDAPSVQAIGLLALALGTLVLGLRHRDWAWVASAVMVMCFTASVLGGAHNGWRAAGMLFVLWAFGPGFSPRRREQPGSETVMIDLTGESPSVRINA